MGDDARRIRARRLGRLAERGRHRRLSRMEAACPSTGLSSGLRASEPAWESRESDGSVGDPAGVVSGRRSTRRLGRGRRARLEALRAWRTARPRRRSSGAHLVERARTSAREPGCRLSAHRILGRRLDAGCWRGRSGPDATRFVPNWRTKRYAPRGPVSRAGDGPRRPRGRTRAGCRGRRTGSRRAGPCRSSAPARRCRARARARPRRE